MTPLSEQAAIRHALGEQLPPDHYASHLSNVNQKNKVYSTEDIYNEKGVLLVRQGASINGKAADRIVRHKLTKPLEEQINIENSIDRQTLEHQFLNLFQAYKDLPQVHNDLKFTLLFKNILHSWPLQPSISQKLTVMYREMPMEFQKSLFSAWLAALLAKEMDFDNQMVTTAFTAGLIHDIGFTHIDPAIVKKEGPLTPEEWRAIQSHTIVGNLVTANLPDLDPRIGDAILEHHERGDGIGYPRGKMDEDLTILGQIVGMADSVQAIRVNQFQKLGRNLRDILPFLQMNQYTHSYSVYKAMVSIIRKSNLSPTVSNPRDTVQKYSFSLMSQWQGLKEVVACLETLTPLLETIKSNKKIYKLIKISNHLSAMINQSGLNSEDIGMWLKSLDKESPEDVLPELNELELMMNELRWQLKNTRHAYEKFFDEEDVDHHPRLQSVEQVARKMSWALERADIRN